jgi:threonine-phosphate decarboxylase
MANPFLHGDDGYRYQQEIVADFSTNTWYKGPAPGLLSLLMEEIRNIGRYPELESESLTGLIADYHHLANDQVLVTNGTAEAIFFIAQQYAGQSSRIIMPTFSEYEPACSVYGHKLSFCGADFIDQKLTTPEGLMWLCNPNNPTGQVYSQSVLKELLKNNPQTLFIIDEAYADFCLQDVSMIPYIGHFKNLIILKSLTKSYCLPGLRLGYVLAHQTVIAGLIQRRPPWQVNSLALNAGDFLLTQAPFDEVDLLEFHALAREFRNQLDTIEGVEVFPSSTGYCLVKTPVKATVIKEELVEQHGLLIRDASSFRTLSEYHIRLATLSREKNQMLIDALTKLLHAERRDVFAVGC